MHESITPTSVSRGRLDNLHEINKNNATWYTKFSQLMQKIHQQLMSMPSHYRYLAIPSDSRDLVLGELGKLGFFNEDGIGRLGLITIVDNGNDPTVAELDIKPERFRMDPAKLKAIETKLLDKSRPDIEVRI